MAASEKSKNRLPSIDSSVAVHRHDAAIGRSHSAEEDVKNTEQNAFHHSANGPHDLYFSEFGEHVLQKAADGCGISSTDGWLADQVSSLSRNALNSYIDVEKGLWFRVALPNQDRVGMTRTDDPDDTSSLSSATSSDYLEVASCCSSNEPDDGSVYSEREQLGKCDEMNVLDGEPCPVCFSPLQDPATRVLVCPERHAAHSVCWLRWRRSRRQIDKSLNCMQCRTELKLNRQDLLQAEREESDLIEEH